jgi:hypothetical protein
MFFIYLLLSLIPGIGFLFIEKALPGLPNWLGGIVIILQLVYSCILITWILR